MIVRSSRIHSHELSSTALVSERDFHGNIKGTIYHGDEAM